MAAGHFLLGPSQSKLRKCKLLILELVKHIRKGNPQMKRSHYEFWRQGKRLGVHWGQDHFIHFGAGPKSLVWSLFQDYPGFSLSHSCRSSDVHLVLLALGTELSAVLLCTVLQQGRCPAQMKTQIKGQYFSWHPPGFCVNLRTEYTQRSLKTDQLYKCYQLFCIPCCSDWWLDTCYLIYIF